MTLFGYADLHCHPMAHLGFGGAGLAVGARRLFWGVPDVEAATGACPVAAALPCCDAAHGVLESPNLIPSITDGQHGRGAPRFEKWPTHETTLHQQMYVDWIKRAHRSGLRLMCALAVHNRLLASLFGYPRTHDLRDSTAIRAQTDAMKRFAGRHSSWMEVVTSPAQARAAIAKGKLAVVLGVEVDSLGDWRSQANCSDAQVDRLVDELHAMGIRALTPIHLADNAFGGCAFGDDMFNLLNHFLGDGRGHHRFFEIIPKPTDTNGVQFLLGTDPEVLRIAKMSLYLHMIRSRPRTGVAMDYPSYRSIRTDGHRNRAGLTARGERLIARMMRRGMLIDVDHMSDASRDRVLDLVEGREYPVYSSHTSAREMAIPRPPGSRSMKGVANEGSLTRRTLERIRDLGGILAPISNQGPTIAHDPQLPVTPRRLGRDTSLSWTHVYRYCVDIMKGGAVAIGTDFNGLNGQPGPRRRKGRWVGPAVAVDYGTHTQVQLDEVLRKYRLRDRSFDYNDMGLAHYGLIPDFLRDVANLLKAEELLEPFFRSAERFVTMWELAEQKSGAGV